MGKAKDLNDLVQLHFETKVKGILGLLPAKVLSKHFYLPLIKSSSVLVLVAENSSNDVVGVLISKAHDADFEPFRLRNLVLIGISVVSRSVRHPKILLLLLNYLRSEALTKKLLKTNSESCLEIQILLVSPSFQGEGLGAKLLSNYKTTYVGKNMVILVKTQSSRAINFYRRNGFELWSTSKIFSNRIYTLRSFK
jgi:ribosomal protein S18 acetylase RimI-like enzyme